MRALRVLGLAEAPGGGIVKNLVCEDPVSGEQFSVPCDDRMRAGARGDLSRFGQLEIELESQLRPREIQSRIRAGATVEQVASLAGTTISRVERFAYPVLLERASIAERAKKARPAIDGITAGISVADTVAATLSARGHDGDMKWDAFKDDDGWILTLTWSAGRSENRAQWLFHPGPDGGTLSARDEAAAEIVDPALRILRPLRPVRQDTVSAVLLDPTVPTERPTQRKMDRPTTRSSEPAARSTHPAGSKLPPTMSPPSSRPPATFGDRAGARSNRSFGVPVPVDRVSPDLGQDSPRDNHRPEGRLTPTVDAERIVEDTVTDVRAGVNPVISHREPARTGTESSRPAPTAAGDPHSGPAKIARKGQRPTMPSWEDVLLGTRSNGH
jgi:hypothetical protein